MRKRGGLEGFVLVLFQQKKKTLKTLPIQGNKHFFSHFGIVLHYVLARPHRSLITAHVLLCMLNSET